MSYWFTTWHGNTCHNQPNTPNYVEGEPPDYPSVKICYRKECLNKGFARIGYPNTGDLKDPERDRLAPNGYSIENVDSVSNNPNTKNQLLGFASIKAGDFIVIPAIDSMYDVHFGMVLTTDREKVLPYINPRPDAYFFYHDIENGDYYECAHRVNVLWAKEENNEFAVINVPEIGGVWRQAFSQLYKATEILSRYAKKYNFW
jgi:hypothetical protein